MRFTSAKRLSTALILKGNLLCKRIEPNNVSILNAERLKVVLDVHVEVVVFHVGEHVVLELPRGRRLAELRRHDQGGTAAHGRRLLSLEQILRELK